MAASIMYTWLGWLRWVPHNEREFAYFWIGAGVAVIITAGVMV
jgi:hypothetical protein